MSIQESSELKDIAIEMPALGESVSEGVVNKWLKAVGEQVAEDEPLVEVTTDKVNTEVPSSAAGRLTRILVQEGETVLVGSPMCIISVGQDGAQSESEPAGEKAGLAEPIVPEDEKEDTGLYPVDPSQMIEMPAPKAKTAIGNGASGEVGEQSRLRERSSPLVRRILEENKVDFSVLDSISGTGAGGRVTKEDVLAYLTSQGKISPAVSPLPSNSKATPTSAATPAPVSAPTDTDATITPLSGIRKFIAERLTYSEHVAPHVTTFAEVDVSDLVALRAKHKQWAQEQEGDNLTYLRFVIKAVCSGLKAYPAINSSLVDNQLYQHRRIHMALAVSLDQSGLILPVIKDADHLGIIELAKAVSDLAARARNNELKPDEARGSTFTISNPGAFGGWISTPIINQPNAAILNTGKIMKMPWVMPDDSIVARSIMYLSLSYDHRIVDGETSVKFLQHVKRSLEQIDTFLLR